MITGNIGTEKLIAQNSGEIVLAEVLQADKDSEALACTFKITPNLTIPAIAMLLEGRIIFGAAGVSIDTGFFPLLTISAGVGLVQPNKGMSVIVHGSHARASARVTCAGNPLAAFPVGVFISRKPPRQLFAPVQTTTAQVMAAGATATIQVPAFATAVSIFQQSPHNQRINLGIATVDIAPGEHLLHYPLSTAAVIQITNMDLIAAQTAVVSFDIEY